VSFIVVDVEADGPYPPDYSMVCFGAVIIEPTLTKTFYGRVKPISKLWLPNSLKVSGISREEHEEFPEVVDTMFEFTEWIAANTQGRPVFISDNPCFDWQFTNYYLHKYTGSNPFGWSGRRIGDMYCGLMKNAYAQWKHLRKTKHDHNPVNDAMGNAEAVLYMKKEMGLEIKLQ
jgi:hypothetical protein